MENWIIAVLLHHPSQIKSDKSSPLSHQEEINFYHGLNFVFQPMSSCHLWSTSTDTVFIHKAERLACSSVTVCTFVVDCLWHLSKQTSLMTLTSSWRPTWICSLSRKWTLSMRQRWACRGRISWCTVCLQSQLFHITIQRLFKLKYYNAAAFICCHRYILSIDRGFLDSSDLYSHKSVV